MSSIGLPAPFAMRRILAASSTVKSALTSIVLQNYFRCQNEQY
jgi:hypothetical protein